MIRKFVFSDVIRIVVIAIISVLLVMFVPQIVDNPRSDLSSPMFTVLLFVFLTGFLISQTNNRNRRLELAVSVELSRLRRLVHLTQNMKVSVLWKNELIMNVIKYLKHVGSYDFHQYNNAHGHFRKITKLIYSFEPINDRERQLWEELLIVTRDAAYHRQQVGNYIHSEVSPYTWLASGFLLVINLWLMLAAREPGLLSFLFITGGVMGLILVIDILLKLDFPTRKERKMFEVLYLADAKDLKKYYKK